MDSVKFREDIRVALKRTIKKLRKNGVVQMSLNNLWQITRFPTTHGPIGVNAPYVAREIFDLVAKEHFQNFIIEE